VCEGLAVTPLLSLDDAITERLRAIYPSLRNTAAIAMIVLLITDAGNGIVTPQP
jgi:hypothetical protein